MSIFETALVGHTAVTAQLAGLLGQGRFPHAVLLHGPRGIGKTTLAHALAARLICGPAPSSSEADMFAAPQENAAPTWEADHTAAAWHQLLAGSCPDFYHVAVPEKKKSIGIDQIRELLKDLKRSADTARVTLVSPLEAMTPEAANALLKVLEEPRQGIYFILVSHMLSGVLPTIRSRCRMVRMAPLSDADTAAVLATHGLTDPTAVPLAQGCPGTLVENPTAAATQKTLNDWLAGHAETPAPNPAHLSVEDLMAAIAKQAPTYTNATHYSRLHKLNKTQKTLNLPPAATLEEALALLSLTQA